MFTREEDSKRKETLSSREMVIYGTPILYKPLYTYCPKYKQGNKGGKRYDMEVD